MMSTIMCQATNYTIPRTSTLGHYYNLFFVELADYRTKDWWLIKNPLSPCCILMLYLWFTIKSGPKLMENRKPFQLTTVLLIYNFLQVLLSTWLFHEALFGAWLSRYNWRCQPVERSTSPEVMRIVRACYVYFLAKLSELLDTVFFVLRKKNNQITFLHLYHHSVMPIVAWGCVKYLPGGHGIFIGFINSFVHIIMYAYYLLAACGPTYQKYIWWKKYITALQLGQFCLTFLHASQLFLYDCNYPKWTIYLILPNVIFFYYLFSDFYKKAYCQHMEKIRQINVLERNSDVN